jgi:hypothetical protein
MLSTKNDQDDFFTYPTDEQERVTAVWDLMCEIDTATNHMSVRAACREASRRYPLSAARLQHIYPRWVDSGYSWRVLIDKSKYPDPTSTPLPKEFLRWVGGQFLGNQRKDRPAWRAIIRRWRAWYNGNESMKLPGFNECPEPGPNGRWPLGFGYDNLRQFAGNTKAETALARVGVTAASYHLPCIPQTREGLRPFEFVFFDDVWVDREVVVPGYNTCRLLQLGALDYASGVYVKFGQRPQIPGEDGTYQRLKERDMKWLVAMLLEEWGYPADYIMHFICERGTATLRPAEARALYDLSDGMIQVYYTTMVGEIVQAWDEKKVGNSRGKSPLESWHNLFHNENANLRGQVGMDHDHEPRALLAQENEAKALMTASHFLSPAQQARLGLPFSDWREAFFETQDTVRRINNRRDHALEGFGKSKFWRINAPGCVTAWKRDYELFDKTGKAIVSPEFSKFMEWDSQPETPVERLARMAADVKWNKIPFGLLPRFYEDCHVIAPVKNCAISFKHDGVIYNYLPETPEEALPEDQEYLVYYRPMDFGSIHITEKTDSGPRYVGTWKLQARNNRMMYEAKVEAIRTKRAFLKAAIDSVRDKSREYIDAQDAVLRQNLAILNEAHLLPSGDETPISSATRVTTATGAALAAAAAAQDQTHAQAKAASQVDTAKEQLKKDLPITPSTEEWV